MVRRLMLGQPPHTTLPVPSRITMALDITEAEGPVVDQLLGVAGPNGEDLGDVDRWETGDLIPTVAQLVRLSECTHFPPEFFFNNETPEMSVAFICNRSAPHKGCHPAEPTEWILEPKRGAPTSNGEPPATLRLVRAVMPRPITRFGKARNR
jgi:hypothetical protein